PPQEDVWNPGLDAEYVALGHIQADEFNRRLAGWNGWAVDEESIQHAWVLLDRHEQGCDAPEPGPDDEEYDGCGCGPFGFYPVTDPQHELPVHFHWFGPDGYRSFGLYPTTPGVVEVTYAFLDRGMAETWSEGGGLVEQCQAADVPVFVKQLGTIWS